MRHVALAMLLGSALLPAVAAAQLSLGARAGYAFPVGDAYETSGFGAFTQSDLAKGQVPLQVEAGWRFSPALSAGLYLGYGFGSAGSKLKDFCATPGASCTAPTTLRYGAEAALTFPFAVLEPWVGVAVGVQQASFGVKNFVYASSAPPSRLKGTLRGWEVAVEGGLDHRLLGPFTFGPYASVGVGQYTVQDVSIDALGTVKGGGVDTPKTHEWITLGLRGRFDL